MGSLESDTTERLPFHFSLSCIGEGNGNPLQCSCLENPRDGKRGGLPSMGSHRVGHDWSDLAAAAAIYKWISMYLSNYLKVEGLVVKSCLTLLWPHGLFCDQDPLSMGFSRQEYWSRLPFPPPGDLPNPEINSCLLLSCTGRQIVCHWATREAPDFIYRH